MRYDKGMSLNYKEIDKILDELALDGALIQQIVQPSFDSIALHLYHRHKSITLLICLASGATRLHQTFKSVPKNDKPLRFMEFLRSRIKGARIVSCKQINSERIVHLALVHQEEKFNMYIRLWSNAANIIVTNPSCTNDAGQEKILDVFYRRPKKDEISGGYFCPLQKNQNAKSQNPSTLIDKNGKEANCASKEFSVRTFEELKEVTQNPNLSFNERVELWYSYHAESLSRTALLESAQKRYNMHASRLQAAIARLEAKRKSFLEADRFRHFGDLLLTYGYLVDEACKEEKRSIECTDYEDNSTIVIAIDPKKNAQENAKDYYERYKKATSGLEELEYEIKSSKSALAKLTAEYEDLCKEQNPIIIQQKMRKQNTPKQQMQKKYPGLAFVIDDWHILVGRSASENDELLRRHVRGQDWWLHTRDVPGGYVFIKSKAQKSVPLDILLDAGNLAVFYSKARKAGTADLYYTQVKYLRRAKNAPKGTVLPTNEKNLCIKLDSARLKRIETLQKENNITLV